MPCCRASRCRGSSPRRRGSPRRRRARTAAAGRRSAASASDRGRAQEHRSPGGAVVRSHEARRCPSCRSARRVTSGFPLPGSEPTTLRRPAGHVLEAPAGQPRAQALGQRARRRGARRARTQARPALPASAHARAPSKRFTVGRGAGPAAASAPSSPPMTGKPCVATRISPAPSATCTTRAIASRRTQSFEVTVSSRSANLRRAASRRVGTCSLGTPSAGAS